MAWQGCSPRPHSGSERAIVKNNQKQTEPPIAASSTLTVALSLAIIHPPVSKTGPPATAGPAKPLPNTAAHSTPNPVPGKPRNAPRFREIHFVHPKIVAGSHLYAFIFRVPRQTRH